MAIPETDIQKAYIAFFNRPADPFGLAFWKEQDSLSQVFDAFATSPEYTARFSGMSNQDAVYNVYQSLFGHEPDVTGWQFWTQALNKGQLTLSNIAFTILQNAANTDATIVANKAQAAQAFTETLDTAAEINAYNAETLSTVQSWLATVGETEASLTAATSAVDSTITSMTSSSGGSSGQSFSLTSGTDSFTGSAGNDTFTADLVNEDGVANVTTLNSTDNIDGGAGTDTLTATYDDATSPTITGVETLTLSDRGGVTFDFVDVSGVTDLNITASTNAVDLNNIGAIPTSVDVSNQSQDVDLDFAADAVSGSSDSLSMSVASVTGGNFVIDTGIESLSIESKGSADNTIADLQTTTGVSSLTLTGSADLTITASLDNAVTTINAAAMTGALSVTQDAAANITVTGGSANDTIDLGAGEFDSNDTVDGGDGTDTLAIESSDAGAVTTAGDQLSNVSNIESLSVTDALKDNVNLSLFGASAATAPTTLVLAAGMGNIKSTITLASGSTVDAEADLGDGKDTLTLQVAGTGTSDAVTLILDDADIKGKLDAGSIESLTINSTGAANTIAGTTAVNTSAASDTITVTGDENLTLSKAVTADQVSASNFTGNLIMTDGTAAAAQITGGSGDDDLEGFNGGVDILTGGAGNDEFEVTLAASATGADVVTDFDAGTSSTTVDQLEFVLNEINVLAGDLGAALTDLSTGGAANVTPGTLTSQTVSSDGTALQASTEIVFLDIDTYADDAALEAAFAAGNATFTNTAVDDNDGILIAYRTGNDINIAVGQYDTATASDSSDGIDGVQTIAVLQGVTDFSNLNGADFELL